MNKFEKEILNYLGQKNFNKIQSVKVGIAGCGGLGSNCAFNLIRSGLKKIVIVDFDIVEQKNLNRQFYFQNQVGKKKVVALKENLLKINPDLRITALAEKIEKENVLNVFEECDIVIEAFDKAEYKTLIAEIILSTPKLLVSASGLAGFGNSDRIKTNKLKENFILIGDLESEVTDKTPPLSPRVNIAAAKQVDSILEYIFSRNN